MDLYITTLAVGALGMIAMALSGGTRGHGHAAHAGHSGHGGHAHSGHSHSTHGGSTKESSGNPLLALMSPRVIFSVFVGFGASGLLLRPLLGSGIETFAAALAIGVVFERAIVAPIWNFAFRFASDPALSLESCLQSDATAVHAFDVNGNGLVAVEVDGRLVQLLGTLQASDRELRAKVAAGAQLRIESVDVDRNRCTVSLR